MRGLRSTSGLTWTRSAAGIQRRAELSERSFCGLRLMCSNELHSRGCIDKLPRPSQGALLRIERVTPWLLLT